MDHLSCLIRAIFVTGITHEPRPTWPRRSALLVLVSSPMLGPVPDGGLMPSTAANADDGPHRLAA